ncbi:MAG: potassium channel family protein [Acidobacteriota bacterium]|nr:potassium channel family protein [Acidobacteriota bacterium]
MISNITGSELAFLAGLLGGAILVTILYEVFEVLLLPRRVRSPVRLVRVFFRSTWALWSGIGSRIGPVDRRANFLSLYGPLSMVLLVVAWGCGLILGFGFLEWALAYSLKPVPTILSEMYLSGTTFFTLGYGDFTPHTGPAKLVAVAEAGTGFGFIAVVIGYLPVLYQLFSQREAKVIQLDARAGSPPCAATLLLRHSSGSGVEALDRLLEVWEAWGSEMIESHLSYPMLSYYRSQHDNESWLAAVTAIMDTCAILLVGLKGRQAFHARMTFAISRLAITELARIFQTPIRSLEIDRLTTDGFVKLESVLNGAGLQFEDQTAEDKLKALRNTYEPFLNGLSQYLLLPLPPWFADERDLDNWQNSPRGRTAKQLVESE